MDRYFEENVYPVLTPMAVDASRPFPLIRNKTLNIAALLSKKNTKSEKTGTGFCNGTGSGGPSETGTDPVRGRRMQSAFILLEQIIEKNIDKLFLNYEVLCAYPYRIMRNADLTIDEDEAAGSVKRDPETVKNETVGRSDPS